VVYWTTLLFSAIAGRVPRRARLAISGTLGVLTYRLWPSKRRVTIANMAQVLGRPTTDPQVRAFAQRSWRNYGRYVSEFFYLPNTTAAAVLARIQDTTPAPGWTGRLDIALAHGRGVLVPTAHFGNWDAAGVACGAHTPLHVIAETFPDPRLNELVQRQRAALGMTVVPMERTPRRILRVLQEHGTVATPVDRPLPAGEGVPITFFGRRCYVPGGIAQLALKTGSAIAPGFCWYGEEYSPTFYTYMATPIIPTSTGDRQADVIALTQRIYDVIADLIRAHPAQGYMFRPFWPGEPEPATPPGPGDASEARSAIAVAPLPLASEGPEERVARREEHAP
jgi:lauroyl/myristoyl acyltransferase